jgi:hypothetical protein
MLGRPCHGGWLDVLDVSIDDSWGMCCSEPIDNLICEFQHLVKRRRKRGQNFFAATLRQNWR